MGSRTISFTGTLGNHNKDGLGPYFEKHLHKQFSVEKVNNMEIEARKGIDSGTLAMMGMCYNLIKVVVRGIYTFVKVH